MPIQTRLSEYANAVSHLVDTRYSMIIVSLKPKFFNNVDVMHQHTVYGMSWISCRTGMWLKLEIAKPTAMLAVAAAFYRKYGEVLCKK